MLEQIASPSLSRAHTSGTTVNQPYASSRITVRLVRGLKPILEFKPELDALARNSGQAAATDLLDYFLSVPDLARRTPHLLLIYGLDGPGCPASSLSAAVLLFEYKTVLGSTRVFFASDVSGRRNIIARPNLRARAAAFAARNLISRGAHLVRIPFSEGHHDSDDSHGPLPGAVEALSSSDALHAITEELSGASHSLPAAQWCLREEEHYAYLPLLPTFNATLARISQKTRANLRYYRRRCESELGGTFVPDPTLTLAEFMAFNRECTYPVGDSFASFRYQTFTTQPNYCVRGVRDANGRWLSLVGTRRQNGFIEIDWQMNRDGMPLSSLSTVLRSYLIEHEISLGSTRLYIEGGTAQPLGRSFVKLRVNELAVMRDWTYLRALHRFAPTFLTTRGYIRDTFKNTGLQWRPW